MSYFELGTSNKVLVFCFVLSCLIPSMTYILIDTSAGANWIKSIENLPIDASIITTKKQDQILQTARGLEVVASIEKSILGYLQVNATETLATTQYGSVEYFGLFPRLVSLISGHLPMNSSEVAIEINYSRYHGFNLSDVLSFGNNESTSFDIVGFFEIKSKHPYSGGLLNGRPTIILDMSSFEKTRNLLETYRFFYDIDIKNELLTPIVYDSLDTILKEISEPIIQIGSAYGETEIHILRVFQEFEIQQELANRQLVYIEMPTWVVTVVLVSMGVHYVQASHQSLIRVFKSRGASHRQIIRFEQRNLVKSFFTGAPLGIIMGSVLALVMATISNMTDESAIETITPLFISSRSIINILSLGFVLPWVIWMIIFFISDIQRTSKRISDSGLNDYLIKGLLVTLFFVGMVSIVLSISSKIRPSQNPWIVNGLLMGSILVTPPIIWIAWKSIAHIGFKSRSSSDIRTKRMSSLLGSARVILVRKRMLVTVTVVTLAISSSLIVGNVSEMVIISRINQARQVLGSDVTFTVFPSKLEDLEENLIRLRSIEYVKDATYVTYRQAKVGDELYADLIGIRPIEFGKTVYTQLGKDMEDSAIKPYLDVMKNTTNGLIISQDLADILHVSIGDTLRAALFVQQEGDFLHIPVDFLILFISEELTNPELLMEYNNNHELISENLGKRIMWANMEYILSLSDFDISYGIILAKTDSHVQEDQLAELISDINIENYSPKGYSAWVYANPAEIIYVDSLRRTVGTVALVGTFIVCFTLPLVYFHSDRESRDREIAILKALGVLDSSIFKSYFIEFLYLVLVMMELLVLFIPVFLMTSLTIGIDGAWNYVRLETNILYAYLLAPIAVFLFAGILSIIFSLRKRSESIRLMLRRQEMYHLEEW